MTDDDRLPEPGLETRLKLRLAPRISLGAGKADLLEGIAQTGSIAAAGRRMGMGYKRAWSLVDDMNSVFALPVVAASRGGSAHGGATLTATGTRVLELYRQMQQKTGTAIQAETGELAGLLAKGSD